MQRPYFDKHEKINNKIQRVETVDEFLDRGGSIERVARTKSGKKRSSKRSSSSSKKKKIDAQKLLDSAVGTDREKEVVEFLRSQGIEVE